MFTGLVPFVLKPCQDCYILAFLLKMVKLKNATFIFLSSLHSVLVFLHVLDLTEWHVTSAALALVDGEPWHMHRPLTRSCSLTLLTFKDANPQLVNQVLNLFGNVVSSRCVRGNNISLCVINTCLCALGILALLCILVGPSARQRLQGGVQRRAAEDS